MPRTYDTGLVAPQRTMIRNAIVAVLAPLLKANGGYLRKVAVLSRPLRDRSEDEVGFLLAATTDQAPAVAVALGKKSMKSVNTDALEWQGSIEVCIYVISSNARSYVEGRLAADVVAATDSTADPGIEVMLAQVEQLLLGQELDILTTLEPRSASEDELWTGADITIWEQSYGVLVQLEVNPNRSVTTIVNNIQVANALDGADPVNPLVTTRTNLEAPP